LGAAGRVGAAGRLVLGADRTVCVLICTQFPGEGAIGCVETHMRCVTHPVPAHGSDRVRAAPHVLRAAPGRGARWGLGAAWRVGAAGRLVLGADRTVCVLICTQFAGSGGIGCALGGIGRA